MIFTRIFVPTDGTEVSIRGLEVAIQVALRYEAELMVVTAVPVPDWVARQNTEFWGIEAYIESTARKNFEAAVDMLKRARVGAELKALTGSISESLLSELARSRADLVIMGRRGKDEPKDLLLGSVSDRVARHVKVPILLVP